MPGWAVVVSQAEEAPEASSMPMLRNKLEDIWKYVTNYG